MRRLRRRGVTIGVASVAILALSAPAAVVWVDDAGRPSPADNGVLLLTPVESLLLRGRCARGFCHKTAQTESDLCLARSEEGTFKFAAVKLLCSYVCRYRYSEGYI